MLRISPFCMFFICIYTASSFAMFNDPEKGDSISEQTNSESDHDKGAPRKVAKRTRIVKVKPVKVACESCRKLKIRCTETTPCKPCMRRGKRCVRNKTGSEKTPKRNSNIVEKTLPADAVEVANQDTTWKFVYEDVMDEDGEMSLPDDELVEQKQDCANMLPGGKNPSFGGGEEDSFKGYSNQSILYPELNKMFND